VLEAHAIRAMSRWDAIEAATEAAVALRAQTDALERGDAVAAAEGDAAFHSALGAYTQNAALRSLMQGLIDASRKGAYAVYSLPETAASSLEQHDRIVEALAASDVEGAARLAQEHMLDVARRYSAAPQGHEEGA
jgi:DNA-binding GntR family transcriptional regulator